MLEKVVGSIFAPQDFPQHILPGSIGVVPKSRISTVFSDIDTDMVIGFLEHFEFCHRVDPDWITLSEVVQLPGETSSEEYYLFPALVTSNAVLSQCDEYSYSHCCGWFIHSLAKNLFFTIRFIHVLLFQLAFHFALPQDDTAQEAGSNTEAPALRRSCTMWKSGITWHDTNGVLAHFEVKNLRSVILITSSMKGSEIYCVRLRTQLIKAILKAKSEFCSRVGVQEYIMEV